MWALELIVDPDDAWKNQMRHSIEENLSWMVRAAERDLHAKLWAQNVSARRRDAFVAEHLTTMACIRGRVEELVRDAVMRERVKRQWVLDYASRDHALLKAQQAMLGAMEMKHFGSYDRMKRCGSPSLTVGPEREPSIQLHGSGGSIEHSRQTSHAHETKFIFPLYSSVEAADSALFAKVSKGSPNTCEAGLRGSIHLSNAHVEHSSFVGRYESPIELDIHEHCITGAQDRKETENVGYGQTPARAGGEGKALRAEGKRKWDGEESAYGNIQRVRREKRPHLGREGSIGGEGNTGSREDALEGENLLEDVNKNGPDTEQGLCLLPIIPDHRHLQVSTHDSQQPGPLSVAQESLSARSSVTKKSGSSLYFHRLLRSTGFSISMNDLVGTVKNESPSKNVLSSSREEAIQNLVNALYSAKGLPLEASLQEVLTEALFKVAKDSGRYPQQLLIDDVDISDNSPVGVGGFSEVYRGTYQAEVVAVKRVRLIESDFDTILKDCAREVVVWSCLSHENILPLRGVFLGEYPSGRAILAFVSPFKDGGDLSRYLQSKESPDRHSLILDIISGIAYLHSQRPPVIHGDIKPTNILVSAAGRAYIGDYGLSYIKNSARVRSLSSPRRTMGKTLQYSAPELLTETPPLSRGRDVFAFGCLVFEIYAGKPPHTELQGEGAIVCAVIQDKELVRPDGIGDTLWDVVVKCREFHPTDRPSAEEVLELLRLNLRKLCPSSSTHIVHS